ncbi:MAG: ATP-dependent Clp protease adaptor ClpS [Bacteroidales bacterium]|jgi:ATP-dependent Clp protease adaptor protein ClpS|nr:ATP-dependent Clp protease adaptor ClpS [Bacteroidales bacterium]
MAAEKLQSFDKTDEVAEKRHTLILFNDDVNSFDHVVDALVDYCEHDEIQAEQCAWIAHYKGKCEVKKGDLDELLSIKDAILNRGINVEIK